MSRRFGGWHIDAGQALDFGYREGDDLGRIALIANNIGFCGHTAAKLEHQFGGALKTRNHIFRVDAALETITRIGDDAVAHGPNGQCSSGPKGPIQSAHRRYFHRSPNVRHP